MATSDIQEYVRFSRYAGYDREQKRRETWSEQIEKVMKMHRTKYADFLGNPELEACFEEARNAMLEKQVLGSQRALQFGSKCLDKNCRIYNCAATPMDRPEVFGEVKWALLCGTGVGISVQEHHVAKLPEIAERKLEPIIYTIPDTIEGWADSVSVLMYSYFTGITKNDKRSEYKESGKTPVQNLDFEKYSGHQIIFNFKEIRPKGAPISGITGKAPGPEPLEAALKKIEKLIDRCLVGGQKKLKPIDVFDIVMHSSDAVLSAGVRRSAILTMFSFSDKEMMNAKTGNWFVENPQRGRSNNSAILIRNKISESDFNSIIESTKQFGEPGFIWSDSEEYLFNPCVEVGLYAYDNKGRSGFQFCNLTEINMGYPKNEHEFYRCCSAASIIGTLQAGFTDFDYLGPITEFIVRREALIGVSMTGMCDNPKISFNPEYLRNGARIVVKVNKNVSKLIGINQAARTTCVKPAGTSTLLLGLNGSGIHPVHAKRYIRRIQTNKTEIPGIFYQKENPAAVKESSWSANKTDNVISFLMEASPDSITKKQISAIEFLEKVKLVQMNWVVEGNNKSVSVVPALNHNVSNTVVIKPDEWDEVVKFIYKNKEYFAGISMISSSGDKDYIEAPFQEVLTGTGIIEEYGEPALFISGLLVHAEQEFGDIYTASSALLGYGKTPKPEEVKTKIFKYYSDRKKRMSSDMEKKNGKPKKRQPKEDAPKIGDYETEVRRDTWILRATKFANNYFNGDLQKMIYCMKDVDAAKIWEDISKNHVRIDWSKLRESEDTTGFIGDVACSGDKCSYII